MKNLIISTAISALLAGAAWSDTVTIATDIANPPYSKADTSGTLTGFEVELANELCARMKATCIWVAKPRPELFPALLSKEVTLVIAGLPIDGTYGDGVEMSMSYLYPDVYSVIGPADVKLGLGEGTIGTLPGRDMSDWAASGGRNLVPYATMDDALSGIQKQEVAGVIAPKAVIAPMITADPDRYGYVYRDYKAGSGLSMAFRADDVDLRFAFEDAIFELGDDGSLGALALKWFGPGVLTGAISY